MGSLRITPPPAERPKRAGTCGYPGPDPFWFERDASQGNRLLGLLDDHPLEVYLFSTGRVGGNDADERSKKITIAHSAATRAGIVDGTIAWDTDPDFGYEIATHIPGFDDLDLLQPRRLFQRQGRSAEYDQLVTSLQAERAAYLDGLDGLDGLDHRIVEGVHG